jgi:hypothetical protein
MGLFLLGREFELSLGPSVLIDRPDNVDTLFFVNIAHVKGLTWQVVFGIKVVNVDGLRSDNSVDQVLVTTEEVLFFLLHDEQKLKVFDFILACLFGFNGVFGGFL